MPTNGPIWSRPDVIAWSQILLDSFQQRLGEELIPRTGHQLEESKALFLAPFVVVSHGTQADPILNYGNQTALDLWELDWEAFTRTPSRQTGEPPVRQERQRMLEEAARQGFIDNYRGVRISQTGRRFLIEGAIVWNLTDRGGKPCGQAATFSHWSFLP